MRSAMDSLAVHLDQTPIELPEAIGTVKSYHVSLQITYELDRTYKDSQTSDHNCVYLLMFSGNYTTS